MNLRIDALLAIRTNPMTPISHLVQRGWDVDFASCACDLAATLIRAGEQLERIPADYRIWLVDGFSSGRPGQRGG